MRALIIPAATREPVRVGDLCKLDELQRTVGGLVELVRIREDLALYCNEEGLLLHLPLNGRASMLAHDLECPVWLFGDVAVFGWDAERFVERDVPDDLAATVLAHSGSANS